MKEKRKDAAAHRRLLVGVVLRRFRRRLRLTVPGRVAGQVAAERLPDRAARVRLVRAVEGGVAAGGQRRVPVAVAAGRRAAAKAHQVDAEHGRVAARAAPRAQATAIVCGAGSQQVEADHNGNLVLFPSLTSLTLHRACNFSALLPTAT